MNMFKNYVFSRVLIIWMSLFAAASFSSEIKKAKIPIINIKSKPTAKPVAKASSLVVKISNIKPKKGGSIRVALWNKKENFTTGDTYRYRVFDVTDKKNVEVSFSGLIPGEKVSIFVHQDLNKNEKLDRNFLGMPIEPYQFGNNSRHALRKARYKETLVKIGTKTTVHQLKLK